MSADFILMEGIRMVDEWPIIEKKIPSLDIVFRPVVDPSMIEVGVGAAPDDAASRSDGWRRAPPTKIRLTAEEERIFRKVDGVRTVQAIIDATGAGEFEVCRTLFDFLNRNIIAPAGRGEAHPSKTTTRRARPSSAVPGLRGGRARPRCSPLAGLRRPAPVPVRGHRARPLCCKRLHARS